MRLCLIGPSSKVGDSLAGALQTELLSVRVTRFPDGEISVAVPDVANSDAYVVHSSAPPVSENLIQLVMTLDACMRAGVVRLTAVIPYFGYARQDHAGKGEALGARAVADMISRYVDRVIVVDPHSSALEGMLSAPLSTVTATSALAGALRRDLPTNAVVVAPDLGAVKRAVQFGQLLELPTAVVHKTRTSGTEVRVDAVIGDVKGRVPVIVDDMISTGGTVEAAFRAVHNAGAVDAVIVAATHGLFCELAEFRLKALPLQGLYVTDTVALGSLSFAADVVSVAPELAASIRELRRTEG